MQFHDIEDVVVVECSKDSACLSVPVSDVAVIPRAEESAAIIAEADVSHTLIMMTKQRSKNCLQVGQGSN